jgi:hypothetical protein
MDRIERDQEHGHETAEAAYEPRLAKLEADHLSDVWDEDRLEWIRGYVEEEANGTTMADKAVWKADNDADAWLRANDPEHKPGRYNPAPTSSQERKKERQHRRDAGLHGGVVLSVDFPGFQMDERKPAEPEPTNGYEPDYKSPTGYPDADEVLEAFGERRSMLQADLKNLLPDNRLRRAKGILGLIKRTEPVFQGRTWWDLPELPG